MILYNALPLTFRKTIASETRRVGETRTVSKVDPKLASQQSVLRKALRGLKIQQVSVRERYKH